MLGIHSAHIPWNAISNVERRRSYKPLKRDQVLQSAMTLSDICRREYALTVDAINKQFLSCNTVSLALDRWTSTNKPAIMLVNACYMDRNLAFCEVQLDFNEVDRPFISGFES